MIGDLWRWRMGRQGSGYEKFLLFANPLLVPFDCYLLRFRPGSYVPGHVDKVDGRKHFRVNIILKPAKTGGEFTCSDPIFVNDRIKFFRPDQSRHAVSEIKEGTRFVLSFGWVLKA